MQIAGKKLDGPNIETVVLPRQDGNLIFKAQSVLDFSVFEKMLPEPQPPMLLKPGGQEIRDVTDINYLEALTKRANARFNWIVLRSLEATDGLTWDTIEPGNPDTWGNWREEMQKVMPQAEINRIFQAIMNVNGLNSDMVEKATADFLTGQAAKEKAAQSTLKVVQ